ncbi:MAG: hypothetical protein Q9219_004451 [cf. Caloplaca sp. 3 TL-2023]
MTNGAYSLESGSRDQVSDSVTQSSINSRRVLVYPALPNVRPNVRLGPRPRSPHVYPSRLKRHGYRPYSPAYSEMNVSDSALHDSIHRSFTTRTQSPASYMGHSPRVGSHALNQSDPLLQYYPALPLSRRHDHNRSPPFLRRPVHSRSPPAGNRPPTVGKTRTAKASESGSSDGRAATHLPVFYDYSEAFEKESFRHTAQRSSMYESRLIPQSDGSSEGYQADVTNTSNTSTKCSSSTTEPKAIASEPADDEEKRPSSPKVPSQVLKQPYVKRNKASPNISPNSSTSSEVVINSTEEITLTTGLNKKVPFSSEARVLPTIERDLEDQFSKPVPMHSDLQRPPSIYDPAPKVIRTAAATLRLSSSSSGSQYSSSAPSQKDKSANLAIVKAPEIAYERQPKALSVSFNRPEMVHHDLSTVNPQQRAASLDAHSRPESFQIFSPVPERSMSSRDSRDRFSRILSIGDDFAKQDLFTSKFPSKKAPMTIQQYLRDRKAPVSKVQASTTKELPPLPDDSFHIPNEGKGKEIDRSYRDHHAMEPMVSAKKPLETDADALPVGIFEPSALLGSLGRPGIPLRYSSMSGNSLLDQPESSRSVRVSFLAQNHDQLEQLRRYALTPRNSSLLHNLKELPPLPKEAAVSIPPLQTPSPLELPCSFTPLIPEERLEVSAADSKNRVEAESPKERVINDIEMNMEQQTPPRTFVIASQNKSGSNSSPASTRPWNLDASYPWAGTPPRLEVGLSQPTQNSPPEAETFQRLKLSVHRSSLLGTNGRLLKPRPAKTKVVPSLGASKQKVPVRTYFKENFDTMRDRRPNIAEVPPSPGLQIEAQSFFSDDSSQRNRKGSVRRRFSQMKSAIRVTSSDDVRAPDRTDADPALGNWRASRGNRKGNFAAQEEHNSHGRSKWRVFERIKSWFHRKENTIKKWHREFSPMVHRSRVVRSE